MEDLEELSEVMGEAVHNTVTNLKKCISDLQEEVRQIEEAWTNGDWRKIAEFGIIREKRVVEFENLQKFYGLI